MNERFDLEEIRHYWTKQAQENEQSSAASWSDSMVIDMEVREIIARLQDGDRVLDVGCANGYSTIQYASQRNIQIRGVDYIPEMIDQARMRLQDMADMLHGSAQFDVGDITALSEPSEAYDKVIVTRVVINLETWARQLQGLRQCIHSLKSGGLFLLSEATLQGWRNMNKFRQEWGMADIPMPAFNQYLDEDQLIEALAPDLELREMVNFSSTYYVGTRVLKPLLAQALGSEINVANPDMEWNRWLSQLPAAGDYGTQKLFVFMKKG